MMPFKSYQIAKKEQDRLNAEVDKAAKVLKKFPRDAAGLTPEDVRVGAKYQKAKKSFDRAFQALQRFNGPFVKQFKDEIRANRKFR